MPLFKTEVVVVTPKSCVRVLSVYDKVTLLSSTSDTTIDPDNGKLTVESTSNTVDPTETLLRSLVLGFGENFP